jgi:hypothetical protein
MVTACFWTEVGGFFVEAVTVTVGLCVQVCRFLLRCYILVDSCSLFIAQFWRGSPS